MWINTATRGEFVLHSDIRHELWKSNIEAPGVLTDEYLKSVGYAPLVKVVPDYDEIIQGLTPHPGKLVKPKMVQVEARRHRDQRLAACDWHGASDNVMSAEMAAYRQALRDVPTQDGFPNEVTWPDRPHR